MKKVLVGLWSASLLFSIYCYQIFPDTIATHYDWKFQPDCYGDKSAVFLHPLILIVISLSLIVLNRLPSIKKQTASFEKTYWRILVALAVLVLAMQIVEFINVKSTMAINGLALVMGIMLVYLGNYMPKVKYNYFVGIRTPWTYRSELNWYKTHRFGGICFMIAGAALSLFAILKAVFVLWIAITMVCIPIIYSFLFYLKEQKEHVGN